MGRHRGLLEWANCRLERRLHLLLEELNMNMWSLLPGPFKHPLLGIISSDCSVISYVKIPISPFGSVPLSQQI